MTAVRFTVRGAVQGVGYRAFAQREAAALGLRGWVRNRWDGAVEGVAIGGEEKLAAFRRALERGPAAARVERVEMAPAAMDREELAGISGFRIALNG